MLFGGAFRGCYSGVLFGGAFRGCVSGVLFGGAFRRCRNRLPMPCARACAGSVCGCALVVDVPGHIRLWWMSASGSALVPQMRACAGPFCGFARVDVRLRVGRHRVCIDRASPYRGSRRQRGPDTIGKHICRAHPGTRRHSSHRAWPSGLCSQPLPVTAPPARPGPRP